MRKKTVKLLRENNINYLWDKRIVMLEQTRLIFIIAFIVTLFAFFLFFYFNRLTINNLINEREIVPYIVRVDSIGQFEVEKLKYVEITENLLKRQLLRFVTLWRDPIGDDRDKLIKRVKEIFAYVPDGSESETFLKKYFYKEADDNYFFKRTDVLEIKVTSVYLFKKEEKTGLEFWRLDWEELVNVENGDRKRKKYTCTLSVYLTPETVTSKKSFLENPLGIYVTDISFGEVT